MAGTENKNKINSLVLMVAIGGIAIGVIIGLAIAKISEQSSMKTSESKTKQNQQIDESIFMEQTAMLSAKVKSISPTSITVESPNNKQSTFAIPSNLLIIKPNSKNTAPSGTIQDIKVDEFVMLNLKKTNGEYKIYSVGVLPPLGSPLPAPSVPNLSNN
jgi:hypothetical protein